MRIKIGMSFLILDQQGASAAYDPGPLGDRTVARGSAVRDGAGIARRDGAAFLENRFQPGERFQALVGPWAVIFFQRLAENIGGNRHDLFTQDTLPLGRGTSAMTFQGNCILLGARGAELLGQHVCRFSHIQAADRIGQAKFDRRHRPEVAWPELKDRTHAL